MKLTQVSRLFCLSFQLTEYISYCYIMLLINVLMTVKNVVWYVCGQRSDIILHKSLV